ncbi:hypothetical protein V5P93_005836 [Actinokineospora auranticolor]|uniref:Uncharacterized protein n=1 Tax=Actinokineospora auranticolor TaxID=155976 RepID=A0A2S6GJK0_9PSEU|nr:hypothetical protein [Actinokineospora auranticolor]PPK65385.1 hypothetical protein CLV40_11437 [Actinokineospora auranticolor]
MFERQERVTRPHDGHLGVKQIHFDFGGGGPVPRVGTPDLPPREAARWEAKLRRFTRLTPIHRGDSRPWVPDRAFSYVKFHDNTAALLARFRSSESGLDAAHAVLGDPVDLDPFAMYVAHWSGWPADSDPDPDGFPPVRADSWRRLREDWRARAREEAEARWSTTARNLVEAVLTHQASSYTLVLDDDPLPVLTVVREVLDPVLSTMDHRFGWTYSTYDHSDTIPGADAAGSGSPRFWCLRQPPDAGVTTRVRVTDQPPTGGDAVASLASSLVAEYFRAPDDYARATNERLVGLNTRDERVLALLDGGRRRASTPPPSGQQRRQRAKPPAVDTRTGPRVARSTEPARTDRDDPQDRDLAGAVLLLRKKVELLVRLVVASTALSLLTVVLTFLLRPGTPQVTPPQPVVVTETITVPLRPPATDQGTTEAVPATR